MKLKFNFFGKNVEIPPQDKKKVLTGAGVLVAGMAAGMSDNKLPEIPKGPLDEGAAGNKTEFKTTYEKRATVEAAYDLKKEETAAEHGAFDEKENDEDLGSSGDFNPDESSEFKFVFNENSITKIEGDSLTLLGKKREVLDRKSPTELGLDANTPLKMKTGTKYKLVNALERISNRDGKIKVWDGFPGKKIFCLVEIDLDEEGRFMLAEDEKDNLYAAKLNGEDLCWNRIIPVEDEEDPQLERAKTAPKKQKIETKESHLTAKMSEKFQWFLVNPNTQTRQVVAMSVQFEIINNGDKVVNTVGPLYLVKQVDWNGKTYWEKVDGAQAFDTYYPAVDIQQELTGYRNHGISPSDYTIDIPDDLSGDEFEAYIAEKLLHINVEDFD
ncbi:MAG: hypothetical protein ACKOW9_04665 [Candidatus Paceibacterota bacterium]